MENFKRVSRKSLEGPPETARGKGREGKGKERKGTCSHLLLHLPSSSLLTSKPRSIIVTQASRQAGADDGD